MRICRVKLEQVGAVLAVVTDDEQVKPLRANRVINLRSTRQDYVTSWQGLQESALGPDFLAAVAEIADRSEAVGTLAELEQQGRLLTPLDSQEVWAAGVTYWRSREARMDESDKAANLYDLVYEAARPELFFKATAQRVVGSGDSIGVRRDSTSTVPEPELAVLLDAKLMPLGFTICNDVTARDIEGANPLYLPQAKIYNRSCAVGPVVWLIAELPDKPQLLIECTVKRDGLEVFHGGASTAQLKRTLPELISYLGRSNSFPGGAVLSTGTAIVPPDDFTLQPGDIVEIEIPPIGRLINPVIVVD